MTAKHIGIIVLAAMVLGAQPLLAWKLFSTDQPDTGLTGISFVDILYNDGIIWLASGQGLSYSTDQGDTWYTRTTETNPGLSSNEASALFGRPGEVWMAGSHFEMYQNVSFPFGDGLSLSTDDGETWTKYTPMEASSFAQLAYDLAGDETRTYAACFYGGLIVRFNSDTTWQHVFYSPADSVDWFEDQWAFLESGRYYSCAVDTTHADTFVVYGGSAHGINKFLYLPKRVKLGGRHIYDIAGAGGFLYLASEGGVTQSDTANLFSMYTADQTNGLGSNLIKKLKVFGGRLWAGAFDPDDSSGLGLYYLVDSPEEKWTAIGAATTGNGPSNLWTKSPTAFFDGTGSGVFDFNAYEDSNTSAFYIAAGDSGLARSSDSGQTWTRLFVEPLDTNLTSPRNQVYSVDVTADSLFLGTKAGLIVAAYTEPFAITWDTIIEFEEYYIDTTGEGSGSWVTYVRHCDGVNGSFSYVSLAPQTIDGQYAVWFVDQDTLAMPPETRKTFLLQNTILYDAILTENIGILATSSELLVSLNFPTAEGINDYDVIDFNTGLILDSYDFYAVEKVGNNLYAGSAGGFAKQFNATTWQIRVANTNPQKHDAANEITYNNSGLPGNWVVGLEVQPYDTGAVLWSACRRVPDTSDQSNGVGFSTNYGSTWTEVLENEQVWNFAFDNNGTSYAASSSGLYAAAPPWTDWQRMVIIDPVSLDTIDNATEVFSVAVAENVLWVGTELGLARRYLDPDSTWDITRSYAETSADDEVFAAPVPYSPIANSGHLTIHYHVARDAEIDVEIYDFAMNLVRVVTENRFRAGGGDYSETWDGYNGNGDMVATGMYFIKVSYSTGEVHWGRLAIIP